MYELGLSASGYRPWRLTSEITCIKREVRLNRESKAFYVSLGFVSTEETMDFKEAL